MSEGCSQREVARRMGIGRNTVLKYADGSPEMLLESGFQFGKLDNYVDTILVCLDKGLPKNETLRQIQKTGIPHQKGTLMTISKK